MWKTTHKQNKRFTGGMEEVQVEDNGEDGEARKDGGSGGDGEGGEGKKMLVFEDTEEEYDKRDVHKKDNEGDPDHLV